MDALTPPFYPELVCGFFFTLVWMELVNGEAQCVLDHIVFLGRLFYGVSAVKFDITYALPIPPNFTRCAFNFVRFSLVYGASLFEGTPGKYANSAPQVTGWWNKRGLQLSIQRCSSPIVNGCKGGTGDIAEDRRLRLLSSPPAPTKSPPEPQVNGENSEEGSIDGTWGGGGVTQVVSKDKSEKDER